MKNRFLGIRTETLIAGLELLCVYAVFYLFGSWPIPDSNEPYYIGKAIHFWQPDWIPNDPFLESRDSHFVFYLTFGWLSFLFSPPMLAQIGRWTTWLLLAWSWQRFSFALVPIRFAAVLTAVALAYYVDSFHMAGEWIIGGVEGKSFAFPCVFFALEAMVRGRWNRVWIFLGIASAFHVLVGGWAVLACGFVRLFDFIPGTRGTAKTQALHFRFPWALFLGGVLALPGLIPALLLDSGTSRDIVREAHQIYVFERLYHHLVPSMLPWTYQARFMLLTILWFVVCRSGPIGGRRHQRFDRFIFGTVILWLTGYAADYGLPENRSLAAEILRFYWFRLADVAVPMGIAVGGLRCLIGVFDARSRGAAKTQALFQPDAMLYWTKTLGVMFVVPFGVYLLLDHYIFGVYCFSWTLQPELGIPWVLTLLFCYVVLDFVRARHVAAYLLGSVLLFGTILVYAPLQSLENYGDLRTRFAYSRIDPKPARAAEDWLNVCSWISDPNNTPLAAKFWVPREGSTFHWNAHRACVGLWKNIPQDAAGIVEWNKSMEELFSYNENGVAYWDRSLTILLWWKSDKEIETLRKKFGFDHIVCGGEPELTHLKSLTKVYPTGIFTNGYYAVYRVEPLKNER